MQYLIDIQYKCIHMDCSLSLSLIHSTVHTHTHTHTQVADISLYGHFATIFFQLVVYKLCLNIRVMSSVCLGNYKLIMSVVLS